MQEKKNTNLIVAIVIILILGAVCYFYVTRDQSSPELLTGQAAGTGLSVDGDLIAALSTLRRLRLDSSIFSRPAWATLRDFSQTLLPQPSGRPNPFAPLEGEVKTSAAATR